MARTTVLEKYQRLEAEGVWRPDPDVQRRDVIVSIGEATLILSDLNENALTHWSLPAVKRMNPGQRPAIYSPGSEAPDTLEITDPEMINALSRVSKAIKRGQAHPGRVRLSVFAAVTALLIAALLFWFPKALTRYTASILPDAARTSIGQDILAQVHRVAGAPCDGSAGMRALGELEQNLFPGKDRTITVLPTALSGTRHIAGGHLLVDHRLVEDEDSPEALARALFREDMRLETGNATERLLDSLGVAAAFSLLTTGRVPEDALAHYAEQMVANTPEEEEATGQASIGENDLLSDSDWIALQQICED